MSQPYRSTVTRFASTGGGFFHSTYWPLVRQAGRPGPEQEQALDYLVRQYAPALRRYCQVRFHCSADRARDFVQGFLLDKVVKRDLIARAREGEGRFRTFLATAMNRWVVDAIRREQRQKRQPPGGMVELDGLPENHPAFHVENDPVFDQLFVRQVVATAIQRTRAYCHDHGHDAAWTVFYHRVLAPTLDLGEARPYEQLIRELGLGSIPEARNRLTTAKRVFRRQLEAVVMEYSNHWQEAAEELADLRRLLQVDG